MKLNSDWRIVPGYPHYLVHRKGLIVSLHRGTAKEVSVRARKQDGYCTVALFNEHGRKTFYVHEVVALSFHGPRPEGTYIDHIDKDKSHNAAENLEYVTRSESAKRIHKSD